MGIGEWLATSRIFSNKQTIIVCPNMHLHLYFMCLYLLRYSWGGCWLRDFSWEITLTAPPSSHRNRRALATKLTVFTQISILESFFICPSIIDILSAKLTFDILAFRLLCWSFAHDMGSRRKRNTAPRSAEGQVLGGKGAASFMLWGVTGKEE